MPLVVVRHRAGAAWFHRQTGLRSLERLDLTLLVDAEHEGFVRRIHVQPHHVGQLLDKRRIRRELEGADAVRLQAMRVPDPMNRRRTQSLGRGHRSQTPLRGARGGRVQRGLDDLLLASRGDLPLAATAGRTAPQRIRPTRREPAPPQPHGVLARVELVRDVLTWHAARRQQHDPTAEDQALRCRASAHPPLQCGTLVGGHTQRGDSTHGREGTKSPAHVQVDSRSLH